MNNLKIKIARFISSGGLVGFLPKSPGTFGSLTCLIVWIVFHKLFFFTFWGDVFASLSIFIIGLIASIVAMKDLPSSDDPQWIVIDEWSGISIPLILSHSLTTYLLSFALFRLFDIMKPPPVSWGEEAPGAYGVMLDDVIAGFCVLPFIFLANSYL